jgi:hypothetical protein
MWLALLTFHRIPIWASNQALWSAVTTLQPDRPEGWVNLGQDAVVRQDFTVAREANTRAMGLADRSLSPPTLRTIAALNTAATWAVQGQPKVAQAWLETAERHWRSIPFTGTQRSLRVWMDQVQRSLGSSS